MNVRLKLETQRQKEIFFLFFASFTQLRTTLYEEPEFLKHEFSIRDMKHVA